VSVSAERTVSLVIGLPCLAEGPRSETVRGEQSHRDEAGRDTMVV
jgi:hypothetical protein